MLLYHYFEKKNGPFRSISELSDAQANAVLEQIRAEKPGAFIALRPEDYVQKRRRFEKILLEEFRKKGGLIERETPHYLVVEACPFFTNSISIGKVTLKVSPLFQVLLTVWKPFLSEALHQPGIL